MRLTLATGLFVSLLLTSNVYAQKTVLITGGLSGIGKEISIAFRDDGWDVWATSRNPNSHPKISGITARQLDITNSKAVKALIKEVESKSNTIDVLINNAGFGIIGPEEAVSLQQAQEILAVNVIGPLQMMQESLPVMRKNQGGRIINISSTSGLRALPGLGIYAASKMALEGLSEALAAEVIPWNIQVSIIEPGAVDNNWAQNAQLAENLKDFPGYKTFTNKLRAGLISNSKDNGQSPQEIAELTLRVAKTTKPSLRYQTSNSAAAIAHDVLVDPTGNSQRTQAATFARELFNHNL